jgi:hypothetical protein
VNKTIKFETPFQYNEWLDNAGNSVSIISVISHGIWIVVTYQDAVLQKVETKPTEQPQGANLLEKDKGKMGMFKGQRDPQTPLEVVRKDK